MNEDNLMKWTEDLSVNNTILDNQHKEIFNILNRFALTKPDDSKKRQFTQILAVLAEYGLTHLKEEEKYMAENGYPELEEHVKEHKSYRYKVSMFNLKFHEISETEVFDFLKNWWFNHITKMDLRYRDFIDSKK